MAGEMTQADFGEGQRECLIFFGHLADQVGNDRYENQCQGYDHQHNTGRATDLLPGSRL